MSELERVDVVDVVDGQVPLPGMPEEGVLFHVDPTSAPSSPDRRRTARQHADLQRGVHPFTRGRTHPELGTCGDCVHRVLVGGHAKSYPKCDGFGRRSMTAGAATDIRASWAACERFEAAS